MNDRVCPQCGRNAYGFPKCPWCGSFYSQTDGETAQKMSVMAEENKQKAQHKMNTWTPLNITVVLSLLMNVFPIFMALVIRAKGWAEAGWIIYFFTIPAALVLLILGLVISLVLYFRRNENRV